MKNNKGFSLTVLLVTIVVILILAAISLTSYSYIIQDAGESKNKAEARIDDDKIKEIMTYELAGTTEFIDVDIDFKRIELSDTLQIEYGEVLYGTNYDLYLSEDDIEKVEKATGEVGLKPYKQLTKSYVVNYMSGDFVRLENDWKFKN